MGADEISLSEHRRRRNERVGSRVPPRRERRERARVAAGARVQADAVRRMLEDLAGADGCVDAGQLVARIVEASCEGGDTREYRMDDGDGADGDY